MVLSKIKTSPDVHKTPSITKGLTKDTPISIDHDVEECIKVPSSGRKPGEYTREDLDELTNISIEDLELAFGDDCVKLDTFENECVGRSSKEENPISLEDVLFSNEENPGSLEDVLLSKKENPVSLEDVLFTDSDLE